MKMVNPPAMMIVDSTMQKKAIEFPTDDQPLEVAREAGRACRVNAKQT
ncbi:hypothetical protein [Burkholderia sp. Bp8986]|nr:hypothetical protein [Burkholderia sp. Bp8986]